MDFVFTTLEVAVVVATLIVTLIFLDGRSNWQDAIQLLGPYVVNATAILYIG